MRTGFAKNENGIWKVVATLGAPFFRSPERGARSLLWLALSDDAAALTGKYIEDEKVVDPQRPGPGRQPRTEPLETKRPARQPACRHARLTPRRRDPLLSSLGHPAPDPPKSLRVVGGALAAPAPAGAGAADGRGMDPALSGERRATLEMLVPSPKQVLRAEVLPGVGPYARPC